jgi:hypothetical protein
MNIGVYELNGRGTGEPLYVELPEAVLPPGAEREVEEEIPGYYHEYPRWIRLQTGVRSKDGRLPVFLYRHQMTPINIDLNRMPSIKIQGLPYIWLDAHLIYRWEARPFYGRVWLPRRVAEGLKLKPESTILAKIRGYSIPKKIRRIIIERYVEVEHMGKTYPTEVEGGRWVWAIPKTIQGYPVLVEAIKRNYMPIAECNKYRGRVLIDFTFRRPAARLISEHMNYAYRNMAVRNYTATVEVDYPFLCEIRATYLTAMPKMYYQPDEGKIYDLKMSPAGFLHDGKFMLLKNALEITVINILQQFFEKPKPKEDGEEAPYSKMSWAEHIGSIDYIEDKLILRDKYKEIYQRDLTDIRNVTYLDYETDSDRKQEKEFNYCIKYVRVLNESSYKTHDLDRWVYLDGRIKEALLKQGMEVDINGFVWEGF